MPAPCDSVLAESLEHIGVVLALRPRHIDISELIVAEIIIFGIRRIERRFYCRRAGVAYGSGRESLRRIGVVCIGILVDEIDIGYRRNILLDIIFSRITLESAGSLRRVLQTVVDNGRDELHLGIVRRLTLDYRSYSQNLIDRIAELLGALVISVSPDIRESVKESADCYICALALEEIVSGREEIALKAIGSVFAVLYR